MFSIHGVPCSSVPGPARPGRLLVRIQVPDRGSGPVQYPDRQGKILCQNPLIPLRYSSMPGTLPARDRSSGSKLSSTGSTVILPSPFGFPVPDRFRKESPCQAARTCRPVFPPAPALPFPPLKPAQDQSGSRFLRAMNPLWQTCSALPAIRAVRILRYMSRRVLFLSGIPMSLLPDTGEWEWSFLSPVQGMIRRPPEFPRKAGTLQVPKLVPGLLPSDTPAPRDPLDPSMPRPSSSLPDSSVPVPKSWGVFS